MQMEWSRRTLVVAAADRDDSKTRSAGGGMVDHHRRVHFYNIRARHTSLYSQRSALAGPATTLTAPHRHPHPKPPTTPL